MINCILLRELRITSQDPHTRFSRIAVMLAMIFVIFGASWSCRHKDIPPATHPLILFAVDGADWKVIDWLWQEGRLPNIKALSERGISAPLHTFHHASPVIWTTVATGVMPDVHGITEFVVPTAKGDQPVASSLRRVPMASVPLITS
jgi:hypothetical protein